MSTNDRVARYAQFGVTPPLYIQDEFLQGYLDAALWTGMDESDESGGEPLDKNYSLADFNTGTVREAYEECQTFQRDNAADLAAFYSIWPKSPDGNSAESFAGHNFWLTRCGHGTGFWDRNTRMVGVRLSEASRKAGERYVYVGDDGELYIG